LPGGVTRLRASTVIAGLVPAILLRKMQCVPKQDGWDIGVQSTPFFERLCPAMTIQRGAMPVKA